MSNNLQTTSNNLELIPSELKSEISKNNYEFLLNTSIPIQKRLFILLSMLGVPGSISGYDYIKDALLISFDNNYRLPPVSKILYPQIAKKYGKTSSQIERAIRHAIERSISRCDPKILFFIFGYTIDSKKNKPTNTEYISQLINFFESMCN